MIEAFGLFTASDTGIADGLLVATSGFTLSAGLARGWLAISAECRRGMP